MVVRFKAAPGDFDGLHRYMLAAHVRALQDDDGFITLALMLRPKSRFHEEQELQGYVRTWNMIHPYEQLEIVETFG